MVVIIVDTEYIHYVFHIYLFNSHETSEIYIVLVPNFMNETAEIQVKSFAKVTWLLRTSI